jgi:hypothetical protein
MSTDHLGSPRLGAGRMIVDDQVAAGAPAGMARPTYGVGVGIGGLRLL